MKTRRGFTLIELIVATGITSLVFLAIVGVVAQMMRLQIETNQKGGVTGWTLMSLDDMNRQLRQATALYCPNATYGCGPNSQILIACSNYSFAAGGRIVTTDPSPMFGYCVTAASRIPPRSLLRYDYAPGCQSPPPMSFLSLVSACPGNANPAPYTLVAQNIYQVGTTPYFSRADDVGGVGLNYVVWTGLPEPPPNPLPACPLTQKEPCMTVSSRIGMNKQYNNSSD